MSSVESFEWFGLHKLKRRVVIRGKVVNEEPLMVGAGRATLLDPTDLVIAKLRNANDEEFPFIPGSSWKGALRSYAIKLMRSQGLEVCDGLPRSTHLKGNEFKRFDESKTPAESITENIANIISGIANAKPRVCLACMIFGAPGLASHARFYDSYPVGGYRLGYRTMVAIDRRTGTARRRALFSVEYVEPGAEFSFRVELINLPNYAVGVIAESLLDMDNGLLKVGGLKTRGFGWVRIKELSIKVYDYSSGSWLEDSVPGLDPIDSEVRLGSDWRETLLNFTEAWRASINKLRRVSEAGWRWVTLLE